jgi:hypothetical protein
MNLRRRKLRLAAIAGVSMIALIAAGCGSPGSSTGTKVKGKQAC